MCSVCSIFCNAGNIDSDLQYKPNQTKMREMVQHLQKYDNTYMCISFNIGSFSEPIVVLLSVREGLSLEDFR